MKKIYTNLALVLAFMSIGFTSFAQDLVINPGGMVTVLDGSSIHVANGGNLIINSPTNSGAPGSLIDYNETGGNITADGDVVFNRFLSKDKFHMITSPVVGKSIASVLNNTSNRNMYWLDEVNYKWVQITTGVMEENLGYLTYDNVYKTVAFAGDLYSSAELTITDASYTERVPISESGFHMTGNKYTSAIDITQIPLTDNNIAATFYMYKETGYSTYNILTDDATNGATRYLAATQGFMYKVDGPINTFTIPQSAKVHNEVIFLKKTSKTANNKLRLAVSGNQLTSDIILAFSNEKEVTELYDASFDAVKMFAFDNKMPDIYTKTSNNEKLAVDYIPETIKDNFIRPMGFKVMTAGTYTINVSEFTFDSNFPVILEDTYTGQKVDLALNTEYTFTSDAGEFAGRFTLQFNPNAVTTDIDKNIDGNSINIFTNRKDLHININSANVNNSRVEVYNLMGSKILDNEITSNNTVLNLNVETGNYIVKVISGLDTKITKVFVD